MDNFVYICLHFNSSNCFGLGIGTGFYIKLSSPSRLSKLLAIMKWDLQFMCTCCIHPKNLVNNMIITTKLNFLDF